MGIGGHILGDNKLNRLRRETGIPFRRAYRRGSVGEACLPTDTGCIHYMLRYPATPKGTVGDNVRIGGPYEDVRWSSCRELNEQKAKKN